MPEDIIDNTSIFVQAMAWCQGTWANIVHDLFRQTASLGHYGLTSEVVKLRSLYVAALWELTFDLEF